MSDKSSRRPGHSPVLDAALAYAERGWLTFAADPDERKGCKARNKNDPESKRWAATRDPGQIREDFKEFPKARVGVACGAESGFWVLDVDTLEGHGVDGPASLAQLEAEHGALPPTLMARSRSGSIHHCFAWVDGIRNSTSKIGAGLDIRGEGGMIIAPPSDGRVWLNDLPLAEAPDWLVALAKEGRERQVAAREYRGVPAENEELVTAVNLIPNPDLNYDEWKTMIMAIRASFDDDDGLAVAHAFSRKSAKYDPDETDLAWEQVTHSRPTQLTAGTLIHKANEASPGWREREKKREQAYENYVERLTRAWRSEPVRDADWPTMGEAAYHGPIGEAVRAIEPESEADPIAILVQLLTMVGNIIGRRVYYQVESTRHHGNLFVAAVGETAKARKGTAEGRARDVGYHIDADWVLNHIGGGLSSGEGLIHQVRDATSRPNKKTGEMEQVDAGVTDKRFMAIESELSSLLKVMERAGSTVSPIFRKAWDGGDLQVIIRDGGRGGLRATAPHISAIGHITIEELRSCLTKTDMANGFANRFLFFLVRRSKELPMGGSLDPAVIASLGHKMGETIDGLLGFEDEPLRMMFSAQGEARWREVYGPLTKGHPGMFGAVTARAEAQVVRIALIYAVLDGSKAIEREHVEAALAVWGYCESSARRIFGEMLGERVADTILLGLKQAHPKGMTRTDIIRDLFNNHSQGAALEHALGKLKEFGLADCERQEGKGRPSETWTYTPRGGLSQLI